LTDSPTTGTPDPATLAQPAEAAGVAAQPAETLRHCPACGTANPAGASFCEACGADLAAATAAASAAGAGLPQADGPGAAAGATSAAYGSGEETLTATATPQTAPAGEESPLDVGWTGAVPSTAVTPVDDDLCTACGQGRIVDGYCDNCGTPPPDPRNHFTEAPATWVAGVCDIGKRHSRNEDAMALSATGARAVLVVCDGVSMATDSHIASLAAAKAARAVLDQPFPKGVGTPEAWEAGAGRALTGAIARANQAVVEAVTGDVPNPPSCTIAAAVVEDGVIVAGNVGDSRVYWLPDSAGEPALQLGQDDSFAQERMASGVSREAAENGPHAHSITRWLGKDAPEDLTPHLTTLSPSAGWLLVCSDGLWNYCSEAEDVRRLVHNGLDETGDEQPATIAQWLVDFANEQGGRDNITVALARLAGQGSTETTETTEITGAAADAAPEEGDPIDG
jgi:serine/threonine protein phosphatase PrpC